MRHSHPGKGCSGGRSRARHDCRGDEVQWSSSGLGSVPQAPHSGETEVGLRSSVMNRTSPPGSARLLPLTVAFARSPLRGGRSRR